MPMKFMDQSVEGVAPQAEAHGLEEVQSVSIWTEYESEGLLPESLEASSSIQPVTFHSQFDGCMELRGDRATVMTYLDAHQGWFCRCAEPMEVEPIGNNGYTITVGRYGSHGFEVEPKISLHLLPHDLGVYRIETLPLADASHQCYNVNFNAELQLVEADPQGATNPLTHVQWTLDLAVEIHFPRFIYRLPKKIIQYTGDKVLAQIVRQVSKRLTTKVQDDFHRTLQASV